VSFCTTTDLGGIVAAVKGDQVAAYCAVIPTKCIVNGHKHSAFWWVDLIVAPEFRGLGLQRMLDQEIRRKDLILGFPNELAARIHRKHGWGVREDGQVLMLPLQPSKIKSFQTVGGIKGSLFKFASHTLEPAASLIRLKFSKYNPRFSYSASDIAPQMAEDVFHRYRENGSFTACRDREQMQWRYLDAPYGSQLTFYLAGPSASPSHILITRNLVRDGVNVTRILDFFGDFRDVERMRDILRLSIRDAVEQGSCQVTVMAWQSALIKLFRSVGFLVSNKTRFCWYSPSNMLMQSIDNGRFHWSLGDSDNDEPA
jgi:hypothetical protein